jgi:hypothetical protein
MCRRSGRAKEGSFCGVGGGNGGEAGNISADSSVDIPEEHPATLAASFF